MIKTKSEKLYLILFGLCLLCMIINPVGAAYYYMYDGTLDYVDADQLIENTDYWYPYATPYMNASIQSGICAAHFGSGIGVLNNYQPTITLWGNTTFYNTSYVQGTIDSNYGHIINGSYTNWAYYKNKSYDVETMGGASIILSCVGGGNNYGLVQKIYSRGTDPSATKPLVNFTLTPDTGVTPLVVSIVGNITGGNADTIIWYDENDQPFAYDTLYLSKNYTTVGMKNVTMCAGNDYGSSCLSQYVTVNEGVFRIEASAQPQSGNASLTVRFSSHLYGGNGFDRVDWHFSSPLYEDRTQSTNGGTFNITFIGAGHYSATATGYDLGGNYVVTSIPIDVYNYGLNITPTPTGTVLPTTRPTIAPNQTGKIEVTVQDETNLSYINGANIAMFDLNDMSKGFFNVSAYGGKYTFLGYGDNANYPFVAGHTYIFMLSKTGYQDYAASKIYSSSVTNLNYYLTRIEDAPPTNQSLFNLKVSLYDDTDNQPIIWPLHGSISAVNQQTGAEVVSYEPSAGWATLNNLEAGDSYDITVVVDGYRRYDTGTFASTASMGGTTQGFTAHLTQSDIIPSGYSLDVSPSTGTFDDTYRVKITGNLYNAVEILYGIGSENMPDTPLVLSDLSGQAHFKAIGGTWRIWDGTDWDTVIGAGNDVVNNLDVVFPSNHANDNIYGVYVNIILGTGKAYTALDSITILSSGNSPVRLNAYDVSNYYQARITTYNSYIYNVQNASWKNDSWNSGNFDTAILYYPPSTSLMYYASANGYYDSPLNYLTTKSDGTYSDINFYMQPQTSFPAGNVTLYVQAADNLGNGLSGATVRLNDGQSTTSLANGYTSFIVLNNTYYTATASGLNGWTSATGGITTGAGNNEIKLVLLRVTPTASIYPTTSPTGYWTTLPTLTQPTINQSLGQVCNVLPVNASALDIFMNTLACNGVKSKVGQDALIGFAIMLFGGIILGKYGKGIGVISGVIAGAGISFYLNLFPFWLLIFVCICGGIVFAAKIFGSSDK